MTRSGALFYALGRQGFVSDAGGSLVAAATTPAGIDEDQDNDQNSEGNETSADPERLARKCHVLTPFRR
jgi:hypothetical protein